MDERKPEVRSSAQKKEALACQIVCELLLYSVWCGVCVSAKMAKEETCVPLMTCSNTLEEMEVAAACKLDVAHLFLSQRMIHYVYSNLCAHNLTQRLPERFFGNRVYNTTPGPLEHQEPKCVAMRVTLRLSVSYMIWNLRWTLACTSPTTACGSSPGTREGVLNLSSLLSENVKRNT